MGCFVLVDQGVLHFGCFAKYAAAFFKKATSSSSRALSRLSLAISACCSFCSSKLWPVCRFFDRHPYNMGSGRPRSAAALGTPCCSARATARSLNSAVYVFRGLVVLFVFDFIFHLGVRVYAL